ncbi:MAG: hypothetical protein MZV64_49475 [Ignavibacteriales bacterium]|nr:hypothetical protein [Ignavibacteriales bacterium]
MSGVSTASTTTTRPAATRSKELGDLLPTGATVRLTGVENIDNNETSLIVTCDVAIPGLATAAEARRSCLSSRSRIPGNTLSASGRKFPVYLPYQFRQSDDIRIALPDGLAVAVRPLSRARASDFSSFSVVCDQEARTSSTSGVIFPSRRSISPSNSTPASRTSSTMSARSTGNRSSSRHGSESPSSFRVWARPASLEIPAAGPMRRRSCRLP